MYLKGIVSSSLIADGSCDVTAYAIFTDVLSYLDWINNPHNETLSLPQQHSKEKPSGNDQNNGLNLQTNVNGLVNMLSSFSQGFTNPKLQQN